MTRRHLVAAFADEGALLGAVRDLRGRGHRVAEVVTPYPVHGLDEALGLRPSRLPFACLAFGLVGLAGGVALQVWTSAVDWPLNVGGKPFDSLPAFVPIAFELTVLLAALGTVAVFFRASRLRPRRPRPPLVPRVLDDRFAVVVEGEGAGYDAEALARSLVERHGAVLVEERLEEEAA